MNKKKYLALFLALQITMSFSTLSFASRESLEEIDMNDEYDLNIDQLLEGIPENASEDFNIDIPLEVDMSQYPSFQILGQDQNIKEEKDKIRIEHDSLELRSMGFDEVDSPAMALYSEPMSDAPMMLSSVPMLASAISTLTKKSSKRFVYGYNSKGVLGGIQDETQKLIFYFKYDNNGNLIKIHE